MYLPIPNWMLSDDLCDSKSLSSAFSAILTVMIMANTCFTTYHNVISFHSLWASAVPYFAFIASL